MRVIVALLLFSLSPIAWTAETTTAPAKPEQKAQAPRSCPKGHDLRQVPMLVGLPNAEMVNTLKRGEALLAGCIGNPKQPEMPHVCETCKEWKTAHMLHWQPLPSEFGTARK